MKKSKDRELLKACFSGDRVAWERFVEAYSKLVYYSIHQTCRVKGIAPEQDEVGDIYGDVFLSLFEDDFARLRSLRGKNDCTLASWIRLIASRKTLDFLREQGRRSRLLDSAGSLVSEDIPAKEDTELAILDKERAELARKAMLRLKSDEINFLHLYYERELAPERIAEILGITTSTVYSKKNRIREKIKRILEEGA